eukprot:Em0515g1a
MPSRNQKKRSKQRAEYLQKREDILSQENKAKARARYKADPEKKKASADPEKKKAYVRDTYKADPEKKKASVRDTYNANAVSKRAAKRQRYQEGVEENRAAKRQRYQEGVEENRAAKRQRYREGLEENRAAKRRIYRGNSATIKAARRSRYWKGRRTTTTTQSYSLFEPNSHTLAEYGVKLEKAILRDTLASGNIEELIPFMGMRDNLSDLFSEDGVEHAVVSEDHSSSGLGCIERDLKVTHADLIAELHHPEKKKASVRDSYKADPEKKKASVRDSYNADIESKQSAKRQRYQEDVEENRAAKRQKYEDNSDAIKASERNRYWNDPAVRLAKRAAERKRFRMGHRTTTTTQSYSLYEPKSHALMEYNGGLEKAILRDSELLSEVNDAFCKSHPLLAQKVVTRSACAAVSKIGADTLVSKALSVRRAKAGSLLNTIQEVNALKLEENDILVRYGYHTAGSLPPWRLDAVLPPYRPPPAVAAALPPPPPPAAAELPPPPAAESCPHRQQQQSYPRGSGIAGVTELPLPPKAVAVPPPAAAAELPPPPPAVAAELPPPAEAEHCYLHQPHHRHKQY